MSASEIIREIERLPESEKRLIADYLAARAVTPAKASEMKDADRKPSFEEAADRVFRDNRELFRLLAQ